MCVLRLSRVPRRPRIWGEIWQPAVRRVVPAPSATGSRMGSRVAWLSRRAVCVCCLSVRGWRSWPAGKSQPAGGTVFFCLSFSHHITSPSPNTPPFPCRIDSNRSALYPLYCVSFSLFFFIFSFFFFLVGPPSPGFNIHAAPSLPASSIFYSYLPPRPPDVARHSTSHRLFP
ncbi:hypothetical protein F4802DRAFT_588687 [Xylaria palmicola]|nr:hypothetical protein F4802DRAFT_588687 [Xylaria palmicola]